MPQHIYEYTQSREIIATRRWLRIEAGGLPSHDSKASWFGLFLPNHVVFSQKGPGDVDLIIGNLAEKISFVTAPQSFPQNSLKLSIDCLTALEVKVSWYDADREKWKASHSNEGKKIKKKLASLSEKFDFVQFLHLCASKPRASYGSYNPWLVAGFDSTDIADGFMDLYHPEEMPHVGYLKVAIGAVPREREYQGGAGGVPQFVQDPKRINHIILVDNEDWRIGFRRRLEELTIQNNINTYVAYCGACDRLSFSHDPIKIVCLNCGQDPLPSGEDL